MFATNHDGWMLQVMHTGAVIKVMLLLILQCWRLFDILPYQQQQWQNLHMKLILINYTIYRQHWLFYVIK